MQMRKMSPQHVHNNYNLPAAWDLRAACFASQFVFANSEEVLAYPRAHGTAFNSERRNIIDMFELWFTTRAAEQH